jgi:hypothetical protein
LVVKIIGGISVNEQDKKLEEINKQRVASNLPPIYPRIVDNE